MKTTPEEGGEIAIRPAECADSRAILALQYLAYQSEARLLGNPAIPPLRETLADVERQFHTGVVLKAVDAIGTIIGSVRAMVRDDTAHIGKLMVHPDR